jgi:succinate dehydrogenase/fumarate reductase flavoprotein subunit/uncharacterized protein with FMN-binding domain
MKKFSLLFLTVAILLLSAVCGFTKDPDGNKDAIQHFKSGTYTATAKGMRGPVKVEVIFSDSKIEAIKVIEDNETIRIGEAAVEILPGAIVANQSLAVDTVASATFTSNAIKMAVADCVKQAGGDVAALRKAPVQPVKAVNETVTYDVVVVGGGLSGLAAATAAINKGAKVALLEKMPFVGGTSVMAEGYMFSVGTDTKEGLYNLFLSRAAEAPSPKFPENDMIRALADNNPATIEMIKAAGIELAVPRPFTSLAVPEKGGTLGVTRTGYRYIDGLKAYIEKKGGTIYVSTPATSLITDSSGAVTGVESSTARGKKIFKAKAVVLASGDFARNRDMMKKYIPQSAACYTISAIGNTGDGMNMAIRAGAKVYEDQFVQGGPLIFDPLDIYRGSYSHAEFPKTALLVSLNGERRVAEDQATRPIHYANTNSDVPDGAWVVMDSESVNEVKNIDTLLSRTSKTSVIKAYKANTVAELAAAIGASPEVLAKTVDRYNELCKAGKDTDRGKNASFLKPVAKGPFYAVRGFAINRGTLGGIVTSPKAEVLNEKNQPIPGLYAAGTVSARAFFAKTYHGGSALGISATMGYVAGTNAASR